MSVVMNLYIHCVRNNCNLFWKYSIFFLAILYLLLSFIQLGYIYCSCISFQMNKGVTNRRESEENKKLINLTWQMWNNIFQSVYFTEAYTERFLCLNKIQNRSHDERNKKEIDKFSQFWIVCRVHQWISKDSNMLKCFFSTRIIFLQYYFRRSLCVAVHT